MERPRLRWPNAGRQAQRDEAQRAAAEEQRRATEQVCRRLREARNAKGLSLGDVERDTRINRVYIEAMEEGHFEALPAPVYARGFMRSYARYLGLDPEEAATAVPHDLPRPAGLEPLPGLRRAAAPVLPPLNLPLLAVLAAGALLVVVAIFVVPRLGGGSGLPPEALPPAAGTTASTGTPAAGTPSASATVPPFAVGETPNFIGVSRATAEALIQQIGLESVIIESANAAPAGQVFEQSPEPGAPVAAGDTVTLFVSQGP